MRRWWAVVAIAAGVAAGWSCLQTCVPGSTESCACTDGRVGAQVCRANGSFEPCICTGAGAAVDAGADGGPDCSRNWTPPQINWFSQFNSPMRVALGQPLRISTRVIGSQPGILQLSWSVIQGDAGTPAGTVVSSLLDHARIELPSVGSYVVQLRASDGCQESIREWAVEVVGAWKLPFVVTDLACCDPQGRAFVIDGLRAQVMRLDLDGGVDATLSLPRLPRNLALDANHRRLVVAQDAYVSFIRISDFSREFEWPVILRVDAAVANDTVAWVYGENFTSGDLAALVAIDGGAVLEQNTFVPGVERGFLSADGGWLIYKDSGSVRSRPISKALERSNFNQSLPACEALWQVAQRTRFITGCGQSYEVQADGGLGYLGSLRESTRFDALAESPTGELAATFWDSSTQERQLRVVDGASFSLQAEFAIGLWQSELENVLTPRFLIPTAAGGVHLLTPDPGNDATWWQEY